MRTLALTVLLGLAAPAGADDRVGSGSGLTALPEPSPAVRAVGKGAIEVQAMGAAAARRISVSTGGQSSTTGERKRRFRRLVTWVLIMLAACVLFLHFIGEDEAPSGGPKPPTGPSSPPGPPSQPLPPKP